MQSSQVMSLDLICESAQSAEQISHEQFEQAHVESGSSASINKKQFQRSFIESRFFGSSEGQEQKSCSSMSMQKHKANFLHKSGGTLSSLKKTEGKKPRRDVQAKAKA